MDREEERIGCAEHHHTDRVYVCVCVCTYAPFRVCDWGNSTHKGKLDIKDRIQSLISQREAGDICEWVRGAQSRKSHSQGKRVCEEKARDGTYGGVLGPLSLFCPFHGDMIVARERMRFKSRSSSVQS